MAAENMKASQRGGGDWSANLTYRIDVLTKEQIKIRSMANITKRKKQLFDSKNIYKASIVQYKNLKKKNSTLTYWVVGRVLIVKPYDQ